MRELKTQGWFLTITTIESSQRKAGDHVETWPYKCLYLSIAESQSLIDVSIWSLWIAAILSTIDRIILRSRNSRNYVGGNQESRTIEKGNPALQPI